MKKSKKNVNIYVILNWKLKVFKRANYADTITVRTWSSNTDKLFAYRDFEVIDENGEVTAIATTKWLIVDIRNGKITKLTDEIVGPYKTENRQVFPEYKFEKLEEPEKISS